MVEQMLKPLFNYMISIMPLEEGPSLAFKPEPDRAYHDGRHILIIRSSGGEQLLGWCWDGQKDKLDGFILKPSGVIMCNKNMERLVMHSVDKVEIDLTLTGDTAIGSKPIRIPLDVAISNIYAGRPVYYTN